ncbi:OmpA family protein [Vibrio sp. SCSIO 43136]|uniref:OmpA family protein n=1 Tax=Vibrio sp. SCSIO 43136 TaxID=2819101 RepID=UPI0020756F71|nr:OmpA family protein [Vibrio sp. SCSIO 43136]USD67960.1 OmpA family protein [Vibrio sp. SCSIO 43136]
MKIRFTLIALISAVLMSGCESLAPPSMLDTAPQTEAEVRYPDWGEEEQDPQARVNQMRAQQSQPSPLNSQTNSSRMVSQGSMMATKPSGNAMAQMRDLLAYMEKKGLRYDVIPGQHTIVKLEETIRFQTGSAAITSGSRVWLEDLGRFLSNNPQISTVIDGHTDSVGSNQVNDPLSDKRATQVKLLFTQSNVPANAVYTRGYGKHLPSCSNLSKTGKACNRRVEIMFIGTVQ